MLKCRLEVWLDLLCVGRRERAFEESPEVTRPKLHPCLSASHRRDQQTCCLQKNLLLKVIRALAELRCWHSSRLSWLARAHQFCLWETCLLAQALASQQAMLGSSCFGYRYLLHVISVAVRALASTTRTVRPPIVHFNGRRHSGSTAVSQRRRCRVNAGSRRSTASQA
jgi:hypothetical protein